MEILTPLGPCFLESVLRGWPRCCTEIQHKDVHSGVRCYLHTIGRTGHRVLEFSGAAVALVGPSCEVVPVSLALFTVVSVLPSLTSWVYSKTRQQETDAKPNGVGVVSLHFGVRKPRRGQKGTRYRHLLGIIFPPKGAAAQNLVQSIILKGECP